MSIWLLKSIHVFILAQLSIHSCKISLVWTFWTSADNSADNTNMFDITSTTLFPHIMKMLADFFEHFKLKFIAVFDRLHPLIREDSLYVILRNLLWGIKEKGMHGFFQKLCADGLRFQFLLCCLSHQFDHSIHISSLSSHTLTGKGRCSWH